MTEVNSIANIQVRLENGGRDCVVTAVNVRDAGMCCRYFIRQAVDGGDGSSIWTVTYDVGFPTVKCGAQFKRIGAYKSLRNAQLACFRDISKFALI